MRGRLTAIALTAGVLALAGSLPGAGPAKADGFFTKPYAQIDLMALARGSSDEAGWVFDEQGGGDPVGGNTPNPEVANSDDLHGGVAVGAFLAIGADVAPYWGVQAAGFVTGTFSDERIFSGSVETDLANDLGLFSFDTDAFDDGDVAAAEYTSRLGGAEANALWHLMRGRSTPAGGTPQVSLIAGGRWVNVEEEFGILFIDGGQQGEYVTQTHNHLYGGQVGAQALIPLNHEFAVDLLAKGGAFANYASQEQRAVDDEGGGGLGVFRDNSDSETSFAALGELRAGLIWRLTRNVSVSLDAMGMYLYGVALAPDQIDTRQLSGGQGVDNDGALWLYGGGVNLRIALDGW